MAEAVARAVDGGRHLVVQAGTGTGKSLAYLVPAVLSGRPTVIATATKALQDQLADQGPAVPGRAPRRGRSTWAVLKGRSNYLCLQRVREVRDPAPGSWSWTDLLPSARQEVERLAAWAATTTTGDRAELDVEPRRPGVGAVSVSSEECPGASRCPLGEPCFAEAARRRAAAADVVVVNTHLYGIDVGSGGVILPEHDVVVIDEAHQLEDITSDTAGLDHRRRALRQPGPAGAADPGRPGSARRRRRRRRRTGRASSPPRRPAAAVAPPGAARPRRSGAARLAIERLADRAPRHPRPTSPRPTSAATRAQKAAATLAEDVDAALVTPAGLRRLGRGPGRQPRLEVAPLDVAPVLSDGVWGEAHRHPHDAPRCLNLAGRVGLPADGTDLLDVGSPFEYEGQRPPLLRRPPARPPPYRPPARSRTPSCEALIERGRRADARPVHQPAGDERGG